MAKERLPIFNKLDEFLHDQTSVLQVCLATLRQREIAWRSMKVIILGNGRIGKTTLANFIKQYPNINQVLFYYYYYFSLFIILELILF